MIPPSDYILVLTATSSREEAQAIADMAVQQRLAAAVQVIGPVTSTYHWKGAIQQSEEWLCLIKTMRPFYLALEEGIHELHSYELPGILMLPVLGGSAPYLSWLAQELQPVASRREVAIQALNAAHARLIAAAERATADGKRHGDGWGPREVLAHVIAWESEATSRIPALAAGAPPKEYDIEAVNVVAIAVIGDQSFEQVRDTLRRAHQRLNEVLQVQADSVFVPGHSIYQRVRAMTRHSDEHAQALEAL